MGFEETYSELFGERWPGLRAALARPDPYSVCLNPLRGDAESVFLERVGAEGEGVAQPVPGLAGVFFRAEPFPPPEEASPATQDPGLAPWYAMDAASVMAARALGVEAGHRVLDLCAAPGGKAWNLAVELADGGELVANDRSAARRARLHRVLEAMLPADLRRRVRVTGHDGARWGMHEPEAYDRVLLDAPCSSEAHVLASDKARADWSPARSRQLARRQYALLAAAIDALRPQGRVLYATCALSPAENDGVIERTLGSRRGPRLCKLGFEGAFGEPTDHGWLILPDRTGFGPIYFALLEKREPSP